MRGLNRKKKQANLPLKTGTGLKMTGIKISF